MSQARNPFNPTSFCFLWAVAQLLDLFCFPAWINEPTGTSLFVAAVAVLLKPSSSTRFLVMCGLNLAYLYVCSPITPNHVLVEGFVNLVILWVSFRNRKTRPEAAARQGVFAEAKPVLLLLLVGVYGFSFLHKLNWGFLNAESSCAGFMLEGLTGRFGLAPPAPFVTGAAIWATFLIEGGVPVLLLFTRTRHWALLPAWGFHFVLAFHPRPGIPGFSAMMFALLYLCLPPEFSESVAQHPFARSLQQAIRRMQGHVLLIAAVVAVCAAGFGAATLLGFIQLSGSGISVWTRLAALGIWVGYSLFCLAALLLGWRQAKSADQARLLSGTLRTPAVTTAALFALNCMAPYLGFQTLRTLSMFSNLRTEGGSSNHLFIPSSLQIGGYQDELVKVLSTSDPWLDYRAQQNELAPYAEIRRVVWEGPRAPRSITFVRGGETYQVEQSDTGVEEWLPPLPFPLNKFLAFRGVAADGPAPCRW